MTMVSSGVKVVPSVLATTRTPASMTSVASGVHHFFNIGVPWLRWGSGAASGPPHSGDSRSAELRRLEGVGRLDVQAGAGLRQVADRHGRLRLEALGAARH